jgi:hypothetical protein
MIQIGIPSYNAQTEPALELEQGFKKIKTIQSC